MQETAKLVQELLLQAVEIDDSEKRKAFLAEACNGNSALRRELEELLKAHDAASRFLPGAPGEPVAGAEAGVPGSVPLEKAGDRIGRYKLLQQIGEGGCGVVYMAEQEEPVRRKVALKVIKLGMDTKSVVARFEAERQALALMDHPNIAHVLDAGATETGRPFFVMELVRGIKITDYCDQNELSTTQRLELFIQVCQAVQHAHQKGIIHRDLKPSNILVTVNDDVAVPKVIDFGIAKATGGRLTDQTLFTAFEQFLGTPDYMSPEQAAMTSLDIDTRSDIYSLGVLLYELLTGKTPFDTKALMASGLDELRRAIREKEPVRPSTRVSTMLEAERTTTAKRRQTQAPKLIHLLRGDLDWIVMKCLEKDRKRRYETANGLARDLQRHLNCEPVVARPPSKLYEFQRTVRRHKVGFAAAGAVIAALAAGVFVSVWQAIEKEHQRQRFQSNVVRQYVANGARLVNEGDLFGGLLWYTEALRLDAGEAHREEPHRIRIASVLRQCPKLLNVFAHGKMLYYSEFSPDGSKVLTTSDDHTAQIWDAASARQLLVLTNGGEVYGGAFSHDGRLVVTYGQDATARIWDATTGVPLQTLQHKAEIWAAQFSPDNRLLATACQDHTAQLWNVDSGERATRPFMDLHAVGAALFSPDGQFLATRDEQGNASLWDIATGQLKFPTKCDGEFNFSPDGRRFFTCEGENLHVFDTATFKDLSYSPLALAGLRSADFSPDGHTIVAAGKGFAQAWDIETGQARFSSPVRHTGPILMTRISPDGRRFATAGQDTVAQLWNLATGQRVGAPLKFIQHVEYISFNADGRRLLGNSCDQEARLWDLATSDLPGPPRPKIENEWHVFSADGRYVLQLGQSNVVWITDRQSGERVAGLPHPYAVTYGSFSRDGHSVLTACRRTGSSLPNQLFLWESPSGRRLDSGAMGHPFTLLYGAWSPDNTRLLTCGSDSTAHLWDARAGKPLSGPMRHREQVGWGGFSPDGRRVVTVSWDRTARVWDAFTGNPLTPPLVHNAIVVGACWSADGKRLQTVTSDDYVQIWDLATGEPLTPPRKIEVPSDQLALSQTGGPAGDDLPRDDRPVEDLVLLARMLAVGRIDASGNVVPLQLKELTDAWDILHNRYPEKFSATRSEIVAWHQHEARESQADGNSAAAAFHQRQAEINSRPGTWPAVAPTGSVAATETNVGPVLAHFPPRDPQAGPEQIDLSAYYNLDLHRWGGSDFTMFPEGLHLLGGVGFDVRGVIHLSGPMVVAKEGKHRPESVRGIPIGRKCSRLHFLQATAYDATNGTVVGKYVLHYVDGKEEQLPLVFGRDLLDWWWPGAPLLSDQSDAALPVWSGNSDKATRYGCALFLYLSTRENPRPDVELASIDFVSNMSAAAPFLVALTLGSGPEWEGRAAAQAQAHEVVVQAVARSGLFPPRDPRATPQQIDLTRFYNKRLHQPEQDFAGFDEGLQRLGGVVFDARGVLCLNGQTAKGLGSTFPEYVSGLRIGLKCRRLHFLQATGWGWDVKSGENVGSYVLHYKDGKTEELPILMWRDISDWWSLALPPATLAPGGALPVWAGSNERSASQGCGLFLYKSTRANPHPDEELVSIDFRSSMTAAAPFLVALTVE